MNILNLVDIVGAGAGSAELYVERPQVEESAVQAFSSNRHVLVYGRPGDGKSSLLLKHLGEQKTTVISCQPRQTVTDLYRVLVSESGAPIIVERRKRSQRRLAATVKLTAGLGEDESEVVERVSSVDLGNVGDVLRILSITGFKGWVVLNDFHLLSKTAQETIAHDLKTISENSEIRIVLVCSWTNEARFLDLAEETVGYVAPVFVQSWSREHLARVGDAVETLLNIKLSEEIKDGLVTSARGCIRLLHEILYDLLRREGVNFTCVETKVLCDTSSVVVSVDRVLGRSVNRYQQLVSSFTLLRLRTINDAALENAIRALVPKTYLKPVRESVVKAVIQAREQAYQQKNQSRKLKAERRRALIELLHKDANSAMGASTSLDDLRMCAASRAQSNLSTSDRSLLKTIREFSNLRSQYRISEELLDFDKVDSSIRITNSRFLAFLRSLDQTALEDLFVDQPQLIDPDEIDVVSDVRSTLPLVRQRFSNVPGLS